jgi:hypothetical protein
MTALYGRIVQKILHSDTPENGERGHYFAIAHYVRWHNVATHVGAALKARGLIENEKPKTWQSDEEAAGALGVPAAFVKPLWNSGLVVFILHNAT